MLAPGNSGCGKGWRVEGYSDDAAIPEPERDEPIASREEAAAYVRGVMLLALNDALADAPVVPPPLRRIMFRPPLPLPRPEPATEVPPQPHSSNSPGPAGRPGFPPRRSPD